MLYLLEVYCQQEIVDDSLKKGSLVIDVHFRVHILYIIFLCPLFTHYIEIKFQRTLLLLLLLLPPLLLLPLVVVGSSSMR